MFAIKFGVLFIVCAIQCLSQDNISEEKIFSKISNVSDILENRTSRTDRKFFSNLSISYIICFFASKGKWPLYPSSLNIQIDQAGRSFFNHKEEFIRNYCRRWYPIKEQCHRPYYQNEYTTSQRPLTSSTTSTTMSMVETFNPDTNDGSYDSGEDDDTGSVTQCACGITATQSVLYKKNVENVSAETIRNTIEFLEGLLLHKSNNKKKDNIQKRKKGNQFSRQ